jgi:hypothetical protein
MALDVDLLRSGLDDYRRQLARQREQLRLQHAEINRTFESLFAVYGGRMSEELHHHWARTSEWFETYIDRTGKLDRFLESRITELKNL